MAHFANGAAEQNYIGEPKPDVGSFTGASNDLPSWRFESQEAADAFSARGAFSRFLRERATTASDVVAAEIVYGELIGNVIRHAPGPILIEVVWTVERRAQIGVHDTGPPFQYVAAPPGNILDESGRGLYIVSCLAQDLNIRRSDAGSTVTALLPVTAA